jgi:hypothetical protein
MPKVFNIIKDSIFWQILIKRGYPTHLRDPTTNMYTQNKIFIQTEITDETGKYNLISLEPL